ncbi:RHS repeat-associated core domain-containing protein [Escherichia coli]
MTTTVSSEHEGWRHSTHRINPDTGKGEDGKFVKVVNARNITWKYDVNGRLVQKLVDKGGYRPLEWRYRWDARSQLTGLETPDGERWEYKYDPFGRRISKRCTSRDKPGMDFHWNGDQLTEEIPVGVNGKPEDENAISWIYEPGNFTPIARYEKGQLHYAVTDTVGRVQELLTEEGLIVWKGRQQLWGHEEGINKDDAPTCRLRFPGQYEDVESGLYYNRFRYYDCETGQYLCADPIGLSGGVNLYNYAPNPLVWIDPLGLLAGPGEDLYVGTYGSSIYANGKTGLNATHTPHHAIQDAVSPTTKCKGITINLRKDLHALTWTFRRAFVRGLTKEQYLKRDIDDLRKILTNAGYDKKVITEQLYELARQNKKLWESLNI